MTEQDGTRKKHFFFLKQDKKHNKMTIKEAKSASFKYLFSEENKITQSKLKPNLVWNELPRGTEEREEEKKGIWGVVSLMES